MTNRPETVCYVGGCGRLGLSMAAWVAEMGYRVICADVSREAVQKVNEGISPISEPRVAELLARHAGRRLSATTDTEAAVLESNLIFVVTPTPSEPGGAFSLEHIFAACAPLGSALSKIGDYRLVAVVSTVMPGHTGGPIRERLEATSGKRAGRDFGLAYSPSFIRQGSIVADFTCPDLVLIGELDGGSGDAAERFYRTVVANDPPFHRMDLASAEIAKIGLNTALVTKTSVANQLAWLCQRHPGADAAAALAAIGSDPRIGSAFLKAGTWAGGPCLPRDCAALAAAFGGSPLGLLADAIQSFGQEQASALTDLVCGLDDGTIGVLGLTYKTGVRLTEGSQGLRLAELLRQKGRDVLVHDPAAEGLSDAGLETVVQSSEVLVLMVPWPEYKALERMDLADKTVVDVWGYLDEGSLNCDYYVQFGRGIR